MKICVDSDKNELGLKAATLAADLLKEALSAREEANLVLASAASQFEMLRALVRIDLEWNRINCFHLDEYVGLPNTHPASFRRFLKERVCDQVAGLKSIEWVNADNPDPAAECERLKKIILKQSIDVACIGIGENGHLAFNDPPADFETEEPYLVVDLDEACRRQQLGEGWFASLEDVPKRAISMSIRQLMKSSAIICTAPDQRKAVAVRNAVEGPVTPQVPASILQEHPCTTLFLDTASASLLTKS
jgi:glucosamine-6-phosphate deaminase